MEFRFPGLARRRVDKKPTNPLRISDTTLLACQIVLFHLDVVFAGRVWASGCLPAASFTADINDCLPAVSTRSFPFFLNKIDRIDPSVEGRYNHRVMVQLLPPRLALVLLFTLDRSKALAFGLSQCLILEFRHLFFKKSIRSASSPAQRNVSGIKKVRFKGFPPVGAAPPPPRPDLIKTRPDPFSGAQEFHQCNNGPASFNNQSAPPPASPYGVANSSERARHENCSPLNVEAIRDSIRAGEHSGNRTLNTCAQKHPEGPKSAELMREYMCPTSMCPREARQQHRDSEPSGGGTGATSGNTVPLQQSLTPD